MIVEFITDEVIGTKYGWYHSKNFPVKNFSVGEYIWLAEFREFIEKGIIHCADGIGENEFINMEDAVLNRSEITEITHCYWKGKYILQLSLKEV